LQFTDMVQKTGKGRRRTYSRRGGQCDGVHGGSFFGGKRI